MLVIIKNVRFYTSTLSPKSGIVHGTIAAFADTDLLVDIDMSEELYASTI